jgi:hypothetical protein
VSVELWHAKAAGKAFASVRVTDLQEVIAQAIKSRRWITEPAFWSELGNRLTGQSSSKANIRDGARLQLLVLCGQAERADGLSFTRSRPVVTGSVAIAQPGLSYRQLRSELDDDALSAVQISRSVRGLPRQRVSSGITRDPVLRLRMTPARSTSASASAGAGADHEIDRRCVPRATTATTSGVACVFAC